jgi:putative aminopeptidase FrvX
MRQPAVLLVLLASSLPAQQADPIAQAIATWTAVEAPPGNESTTAALLTRALGAGWTADAQGNLIKRVGSGTPKRVVACAMDFSSYVVSQVTEQGYLRVRRTGAPGHPLWDQFHEAQRVAILGARARHTGVVAVANGHFTQQHRGDTIAATMDDLWIDVGASSKADVERMGIALIDPVVIDRPQWSFEGYAAGPAAGARAGCAALATAAAVSPPYGETTFIISNQKVLGWRGLAVALTRIGQVQSVTLLDDGGSLGQEPVTIGQLAQRHSAVRITARADVVRVLTLRVRFPRSLVETVHADDARILLDSVAVAAGVARPVGPWVGILADTARRLAPREAQFDALERLWMSLVDLPGVAGHEHPVRAAILAALPGWARQLAAVDSIGNVVLAVGPNRDSVAFIAHMDEVGFEVTNILRDGRVALRTRGGAVVPSWEGTPAYLNFDPAGGAAAPPLRGVFVPRDTGRLRAPTGLTAWFGLDSAALVARGARVGLSVTSYKRAARLAGTRVTGRGSDDRSGSTALLRAVSRIELGGDTLRRKVVFVWSVQEEGGLNGARYFGNQHGANLRRVYSVDTFVSSDTPLESPHFAYTPLGSGAVLRSVDNSSIVPREDRERIISIARAHSIPLQVGTTFGGTDGSAIQMWGPNNIGLSWPGRYSHGPAEVLDLRDLEALSRLILAVAQSR